MERVHTTLCLSRKPGESFWIEDVEVEVYAVEGKKVKIKIKAHPDVKIDRAEIRSKRERAAANREKELACTAS
jgi:carbon storage regulator CsrA